MNIPHIPTQPGPRNVGELIDLLNTYPREAEVDIEDDGGGGGLLIVYTDKRVEDVWVTDRRYIVWETTSDAAHPYGPVVKEPEA